MKIKGTCRNCGREFLVQQLFDSQGHCPWCGLPFQPHYTAVLVDALQMAEAAGGTLENALEKVADMHPAMTLDEDSVLAEVRSYLEQLRRGEPPRSP